jgi:hypothetical protein
MYGRTEWVRGMWWRDERAEKSGMDE